MFLDTLFFFFNFLFFYKKILNKLNQKQKNIFFSCFHSIFTFGNAVLFLNKSITADFYLRTSILTITYAIYDIFFLLKYKSYSYKKLIIHNLIIVFANIWINYWGDIYTIHMVAYNYLNEISTPFLNLSLFLYQNKKTKFSIYKINIFKLSNILLIITFFAFRILFGLYLINKYFFCNWLYIFQIVLFYFNLLWFLKIFNFITN